MVKHFFKALGLFIVMIILALIGVVVVNHYEQNEVQTNTNNQVQVAK
jgi:hypothetical protein